MKIILRKLNLTLLSFALIIFSIQAAASEILLPDLTIKKIRAVGSYASAQYSNTIEVWFTTTVVFPSGITCAPGGVRVAIDAKHKHLVAAAYLALASGKKVSINVDDTLPKRDGMCELSFLDVEA